MPPGDSEPRSRTPWPILLSVGLAVIVIDQLTKVWAVAALDDRAPIGVFWTLRLNLVRNDGAAFSIGSGLTPFIAVLAMLVSVALIVAARRVTRPAVLVSMGLILGGALGNVVDRFLREGDGFLRGRVVDFLDLQWWPVFNVADMAIVIGGFLLVIQLSDDGIERVG